MLWLFFIFVGACGAAGALLNKAAGRPRYNGWLLAAVVLVIWTIVATVQVRGSTPKTGDPFEQGREHGRQVPTLFPIVLASWAAWRFQMGKNSSKK